MNTILTEFERPHKAFIDTPFEFRLKTKTFIDGTVHMIMTRIRHKLSKSPDLAVGQFITVYPKSSEEKQAENIIRATRRAKEAVAHSIRQIKADHMLTLHTRENIENRDEFFTRFTRFMRLLRGFDLVNGDLIERKEPRFFPYVAVPEKQERGAYHIHMAVCGYQDIPLLRACWYRALGGNISDKGEQVKGQIDVTSQGRRFSNNVKPAWDIEKLVQYLTKYIGKSFEQDNKLGQARYSKSRGQEQVNIQKQFLISCWSNGEKTHIDAMKEVISIAEFMGVQDSFIWGRFSDGWDVFTLKGKLL